MEAERARKRSERERDAQSTSAGTEANRTLSTEVHGVSRAEERPALEPPTTQGSPDYDPASWIALFNLAMLGDKAGSLVDHGVANAFRLSADVANGLTYSLSVERTADDAE